jgi:hypothetical protein
LDGNTRLELPFGVVENEPGVDSAANQGLWAESLAYPALFLTQPGVRWEALDDTRATLDVPFKDSQQQFTVTFDPESGEIVRFETDRYRDAKVGTLHWWGDISARDGKPYFSVTWEDEGTPWLNYALEETAFNADLSDYIRHSGP